jgi:hypothetical protein
MKKKLNIILTVLVAMSLSAYAKTSAGIYLNLSDYRNNKLSCESEKGTHIHIRDFFWNMSTIRVVNDGKKITYRKSELYGYRDGKDDVYRFYHNTEYRIAEAGNIYIYVQEKNIAQSKGYKVVNKYYFSTGADSEILPLTINNLKYAYKGNDKFCDLADQFFSRDDAFVYDQQDNTFKANYVYSKAIQ